MDYSPPASSPMGFTKQEYWSGLPCPLLIKSSTHVNMLLKIEFSLINSVQKVFIEHLLYVEQMQMETRTHKSFSFHKAFLVVMYRCESWTIKKAEGQITDAFELWCWRRLLRVPWTARRSNQSILKEISPWCSLEGLMLKLKL